MSAQFRLSDGCMSENRNVFFFAMPSMLFTYFPPIFFSSENRIRCYVYSRVRFGPHGVRAIVQHWNFEIVQLMWPLITKNRNIVSSVVCGITYPPI